MNNNLFDQLSKLYPRRIQFIAVAAVGCAVFLLSACSPNLGQSPSTSLASEESLEVPTTLPPEPVGTHSSANSRPAGTAIVVAPTPIPTEERTISEELEDFPSDGLYYNDLFLDKIQIDQTCRGDGPEPAVSLLVVDLSSRKLLAAILPDKQMPVASAFKGPLLLYALSNLDPEIWENVPVKYWSQEGQIPEEYLLILRENWILSRLYDMIVHSSNKAAAEVLVYVNENSASDLNPIEQFNTWSQETIGISPSSGLYEWEHGPAIGQTDERFRNRVVTGQCGQRYYFSNTYSGRDLAIYYAWLAEEAPQQIRVTAYEILSIIEEEPGFLENAALDLGVKSVSKAGYFSGKNTGFVWVDSGLIVLADGSSFLIVTATLNAAEVLPGLYDLLREVIQLETGRNRLEMIASISRPVWADLLKQAASAYVVESSDGADQIARKINWLPDQDVEDSSMMCGPLSGAILQDAGFLPPDFDLGLLWLPDPIRNGRPWTLFSREEFYVFGFRSPYLALARFNFLQFPLLPGDMIYSYGGSGTHVFVVTEIDASGRAYTVTNYCLGEDNCPIRRMLLYDLEQPGQGAFYHEFQEGWFRTGQMGFDVLRSKEYPQVFSDLYFRYLIPE
jgi:hypothetical protein